MRILLIEDDARLAASIMKHLKVEHFAVDHAADGIHGEELAIVNYYDAIILDIRLPLQDGWTTCAHIRAAKIPVPIIILTALDDVSEKIRGLNTGADDYLTKPFHADELIARLRALIRRHSPTSTSVMDKYGVTMHLDSSTVFRDGKQLFLTAKEFALLELLMLHAGKVVTHEMIIESLWDTNFDPHSNVVEALVKLLRQKVDKGFSIQLICTVRGFGYKFQPE